MDVLWIAVPAAVLIIFAAIAAFVWAVRTGQMDDLDTPAMRMLHDDDEQLTRRGPDKNSRDENASERAPDVSQDSKNKATE